MQSAAIHFTQFLSIMLTMYIIQMLKLPTIMALCSMPLYHSIMLKIAGIANWLKIDQEMHSAVYYVFHINP